MKHILLIVMLVLFSGCFSTVTSSEKNSRADAHNQKEVSMQTEKERCAAFFEGCTPLAKSEAAMLKVNAAGFVSLPENATAGYLWHYTISDIKVLAPLADDRFNFSRPDIAGAPQQHVWKFKALNKGSCKIIFKYFRAWEGEGKAADSCEYEVTVK